VQNLVLNAGQAMAGSGVVEIGVERVVLEDGAHPLLPAGGYALVSIVDRGPGIPRELAERVFDPFFTTKESGTGLGLTTAYSIAAKAGGTLELSRRRGGGTVARLYLPLTERPLPERPAGTAPSRGGGARILLMDDETMVRRVALSMLAALGYAPVAAREGTEAVRLYREAAEAGRPFAAVVVDLTVPGGLSGEETLERLRELDPQARVVASSGYAAEPEHRGTGRARFSGFLPKPYSLTEMGRVLEAVLPDRRP
jgi:two-component system cell cycle sensor histidine kinase/response regulator CckA